MFKRCEIYAVFLFEQYTLDLKQALSTKVHYGRIALRETRCPGCLY